MSYSPQNANSITYFNLAFGDWNKETGKIVDLTISNNKDRIKSWRLLPLRTRKKHVRQTILIVGGILFLLSLFELMGDQKISYSPIKYAEHLSPVDKNAVSNDQSEEAAICAAAVTIKSKYRKTLSATYSSFTFTTSVKKYLLVRSLRI